MKVQLQLNNSKISEKHPLLVGAIDVEGLRRVAIWHHEDRGSEYYSGKLTQGDRDPNPINMKAFGSFNKTSLTDPDWYTREPFQIGDSMYYAYMWTVLDQDEQDIHFHFEITEKVYAQKMSDEVAKFKEKLKEKLKSTKPVPAAIDEQTEPDDIPF
jgi:hypothetical protein